MTRQRSGKHQQASSRGMGGAILDEPGLGGRDGGLFLRASAENWAPVPERDNDGPPAATGCRQTVVAAGSVGAAPALRRRGGGADARASRQPTPAPAPGVAATTATAPEPAAAAHQLQLPKGSFHRHKV
jgi:hypothetical protein